LGAVLKAERVGTSEENVIIRGRTH